MELRAARVAAALLALAVLLVAAPAAAADSNLKFPPTQNTPPPGYRLTAKRVIAIASPQPKVRDEVRNHGRLEPVAYLDGPGAWQVSFFQGRTERAQVIVSDVTGKVFEAWNGIQVAWKMARGYPGAFAGVLNAVYIWIPLCVLFVAPFFDFRRPFRLLHLDLLVLVGFSLSLAFFNHGSTSISVPAVYPVLVYLLVRMLIAGFRPRPGGPLIPHMRATWLLAAIVALAAFRLTLNIIDSGVIDVGYGGIIGADRIFHGHGIYTAGWPHDIDHGDTYGPFSYLAYLPFRALFGFSGHWDRLPAAHAASLAFDLLTIVGLMALGRRLRPGRAGAELGIALGFAWSAFPFTLFALDSNTNDELVALLLVAALLVLTSAPARGAMVGLAAAAKFAPLGLLPLFASGTERSVRRALIAVAACAVVLAATFVPFLPHGGIKTVWDHTVGYQAGRNAPFSIWGQHHSIGWLWTLTKVAAGVLAVAVAFVPRRRGPVQVAALAAAVMIGVELCTSYWFYLYIVWFLPAALVAIFGLCEPSAERRRPRREEAPELVPA